MTFGERSGWRSSVLLGLALLAGPGCSYYRPTATGYLSDYNHLERDRFHLSYAIGAQTAYTRYATCDELCRVDSFYIEPVEWLVEPGSRADRDPSRKEVLSARLHEELAAQLGTIRPVVLQPGPNTARVRSAITTVRLCRPVVNAALTAGTFFTPWAVGPIFFGGGAVEAEVVGPDGRQIAAITAASSGGYLDIIGFYTRSGHAKKAMHRCVGELREAVEKRSTCPVKHGPDGRPVPTPQSPG